MDFTKLIRRVTSIQAKKIIAESKKPIIVQLFSHACLACHEASNNIQAASNRADDVEVIAVDGDFNQEFVDELGVDGFPTAVAFRNGQRVAHFEGAGETPEEYTKFFLKCLHPKPIRKAGDRNALNVAAAKPKPKPKPKAKPKAKPKVKPKKKRGRPKGSKNRAQK